MGILFGRVFSVLCTLLWLLSSHPPNATAGDDWDLLFQVPLMTIKPNVAKRTISGYVRIDGQGLADVSISEGGNFLAYTNDQGYYEARVLLGLPYTLTPGKSGYLFTPPNIAISGGRTNLSNQNFDAEKIPTATISGQVVWKNSGYVTIAENPLPNIVVEAYEWTSCYDENSASLHSRSVTDTDGMYSLSLPTGWCGYIAPYWESGVGFYPKMQTFYRLNEDKIRNFLTPNGSETYTITVAIKAPNGDLLPPSHHFQVDLDGINYANGANKHTGLVVTLGECYFSNMPHGWIGEITPSYTGGIERNYTFDPPSIRMNGILSSDRTFSFKATEN